MNREQLLTSLKRVIAIDAGAIRDTVLGVFGTSAESEGLAELLIVRRDDLARRATALATD
jgi:hypothetical protein